MTAPPPPAPPQEAPTTRSLPSAPDVERKVVGALLVDQKRIGDAVEVLGDGEFLDDLRLRHVYRAVVALFDQGEPVDQITVGRQLEADGLLESCGGVVFLTELAGEVVSGANVAAHAQIVRDTGKVRGLIQAYALGQDLAHRPGADPVAVADTIEGQVLGLIQEGHNQPESLEDVLQPTAEEIERVHKAGTTLTGVPGGLRDVDDMTSGWQKSDLIILAARPSVGKTALSLTMVRHAAEAGVRVAFFSLEMSKTQLGQRLLALSSKVDLFRMRSGRLRDEDWVAMTGHMTRLSQLPVWIDDTAGISTIELRAKARRLHQRHGIGLVVVDYLQLMTHHESTQSREQEVAKIARGLKGLAKELNCPVIALSQLSRASESRADKRPVLSDLRESGCLSGDTRVYLPSLCAWVTLREIASKAIPPDDVASLVGKEVIAKQPSAVFSTGRKPVWRLTTGSGLSVKATRCHRFMTPDGWKRLEHLTLSDKIAVPASLPSGETKKTLSESELTLMAHLIGDGSTLPRSTIQYTSNIDDLDLAEVVTAAAEDVFGDTIRPRTQVERNWIQTYFPAAKTPGRRHRHPMVLWLEQHDMYGRRSPEKIIPAEVFRQPTESIREFLRHLWSTDGTFHVRERETRGRGVRPPRGTSPIVRISFSTSSGELARGVHDLLLRCQIKSHIRTISQGTHRDSHQVIVCGNEGRRRFVEDIGSVGQRRLSQLEAVREATVGTDSEAYDSGIYWDSVFSIEKAGVEDVYDITVPGAHNFVAEGVVVHNSIEQDADVVLFLHPEVKGGERTGIVEFIFAKHRNGPTGSQYCLFHKQSTSFENLAPEYIRDMELDHA